MHYLSQPVRSAIASTIWQEALTEYYYMVAKINIYKLQLQQTREGPKGEDCLCMYASSQCARIFHVKSTNNFLIWSTQIWIMYTIYAWESEPAGFELRSGCRALTTIVIFGLKSASYWTQSAATAAIWKKKPIKLMKMIFGKQKHAPLWRNRTNVPKMR